MVSRERWSWGRLQRHRDLCIAHALCSPYVRAVLRRWGRGESDLRELYMRMSDAGMRPDRREAAVANPDLETILSHLVVEEIRSGNLGPA